MGEATEISWTDHTFNPWWGCTRVSPGCNHCYAETFAKRTGHDIWGKGGERRFFGDKHWAEPLKWDRDAAAGVPGVRGEGRHLVFCASMADVFEDRDDLIPHRERLFSLIAGTPFLDWQLLTKRPENVARLARDWMENDWPGNVWIGTTVEDQQRADERIPRLLEVPASVRFLSCEPLLGAVDLATCGAPEWCAADGRCQPVPVGINWVIAGGESGAGHRPLNLAHARSLRDQCQMAGVPFFFKQVGGRTPKAGGKVLDGREWCEIPDSAVYA